MIIVTFFKNQEERGEGAWISNGNGPNRGPGQAYAFHCYKDLHGPLCS